jgi:hypothetical protein
MAKGAGAFESGIGDGLNAESGELAKVGQVALADDATGTDDADAESWGVGRRGHSAGGSRFDACVKVEDAEDFVNSFRFLGAAMGVGDNEFGLSAVEMGTGIGDDAVCGVWRNAFAVVPDNRVMGDKDGALVHGLKVGVPR